MMMIIIMLLVGAVIIIIKLSINIFGHPPPPTINISKHCAIKINNNRFNMKLITLLECGQASRVKIRVSLLIRAE